MQKATKAQTERKRDRIIIRTILFKGLKLSSIIANSLVDLVLEEKREKALSA